MKTSNKLLIGLLIAIIIIPTSLLFAFNYMINNTTAEIVKHQPLYTKTTDSIVKPYHTVIINEQKHSKQDESPRFIINVRSYQGSKYLIQSYNPSVKINVHQKQDTLFIDYKNVKNANSIKPLNSNSDKIVFVDLYLPKLTALKVFNASVRVYSKVVSTSEPTNYSIHKGTLLIGLGIFRRNNTAYGPPYLVNKRYENPQSNPSAKIERLSIQADSSYVILGYTLAIDSLGLAIEGNSKLVIAPDIQVKEVDGHISSQSHFYSSGKIQDTLIALHSK